MTLAQVLGDTEDATIVKLASDEKVATTKGTGHRSSLQSGESRAWGMSGDVD